MSNSASEIRQQFIDFFVNKCGHAFIASSPVVPHDDPTLMFANAGMNQFKPYFLGSATPPHARVANTQKCIRAGGKHNDLDDVGHDTYHHTFFEMLGNWSFGDYFKTEAIEWAWELLTKVWGIDGSRLHATYFEGDASEGLAPDTEARDLWLKILPAERVHPGNKKDNFWEMGDTGPCGPCSEIHIDLTPDKSGGPLVNGGSDKVIEIWNLVFIQFNRGADKKLSPLPAKHVDTGMGFERITAVLQKVGSNYNTDIFKPIFEAIRNVTGAPAYGARLEEPGKHDPAVMVDVAYRVVADHIRTLTFALTDGAVPGSDGRGYVLRRILRRAVRYGRQYLRTEKPFLCELVPVLAELMSGAFPELTKAHQGRNVEHVAAILRDEEESFGRTLDRGIALFQEAATVAKAQHHGRVAGEDAFKLHDTYGFPIDLTQIMAQEMGMSVDVAEYERLMEEAKERARSGGKAGDAYHDEMIATAVRSAPKTDDSPKFDDTLQCDATIVTLVGGAQPGDTVAFTTNRTCFYAEQGGQVGDHGVAHGGQNEIDITDTLRRGDSIVHVGRLKRGKFTVGDSCHMTVSPKRHPIMSNHTSTHLLNWALREVLGDHVQQKGSLVDAEKTRFDFSHTAAMQDDQVRHVEELVNRRIEQRLHVHAKEVPQVDALKINSLRAVFGEKYPDIVRVVSIGPTVDELLTDPENSEWRQYSIEFCGGTHLRSTGDAVRFRLIEESAVAKGVRRLIGITGDRARQADTLALALHEDLKQAARLPDADLGTRITDLSNRIEHAELPLIEKVAMRKSLHTLQDRVREFQKQQSRSATSGALETAEALLNTAARIGDTALVCGDLGEAGVDQMRAAADSVRSKAGSAAVLFAARQEDRVVLLAALTPDLNKRGIKAGDLIRDIAPVVGGKGGGRPDMAQGGGNDVSKIPAAVTAATEWLKSKLA